MKRKGLLVTGWMMTLVLAGCAGRSATPAALPTEIASMPTAAPATSTPALPTLAPTEAPIETPSPEPEATATEPPVRAAEAGEIYVDASAARGVVSPFASGVTWGPLWQLRPDVMPLAEQLAPGMIAFPGGEYGDNTNLQPLEIDRLMELSARLGAEPFIHVRLPGGTPEQAVALMDYTNKQKGYNVKYWAIGNEPNLYAGKHTNEPWDATYFATEWRRFAEAMKAADPSILLVGPEITQFVGTENLTRGDEQQAADWMRTFLEMNGDLVDIVSFHRYAFPKDMTRPVDTKPEELFANAPEWDAIIPALRALMVETTGRELPIAVTEVNSHYTKAFGRPASPDSLPNALWWGDVFMRMVRQQVEIVNFWTLVTNDSQGGWGVIGRHAERPVFHTFMLYQQLGTQLVAAEAGLPGVQALAALRDDGALTLMVSNLSATAQEATLQVEGVDFAGAQVWRLDAEHMGVPVDGETVENGGAITLPPESLSLYILQ
jgi:hypothetical protein